jgi:mannose-6-phosphate isomerase-like protein (cupin superfamily)
MPDNSKMDTSLVTETGGPVDFRPWYAFREGGPVERGGLPFPKHAPAPFELARWTVAPGTANDLDVHRSREVWIVVAGAATVVWDDNETKRLQPGDIMAFESLTPHQLINDGLVPFVAASVFWLDATSEPAR